MLILAIMILVVCVLLLYIRIRLNKYTTALDKIITLTIGMILFQVLYIYVVNDFLACCGYLDALAPFRLFYPPILYLMVQLFYKNYLTVNKQQYFLHFLPILFFLLVYVVFSVNETFRMNYGTIAFKILIIAETISALFYSIWCVIILYKPSATTKLPTSVKTGLEMAVFFTILTGSFSLTRYFEISFVEVLKFGRFNQYSFTLLLVISLLLFIISIEELIDNLKTKKTIQSENDQIIDLINTTQNQRELLQYPEMLKVKNTSIGTAEEIHGFLENLYQLEDSQWFLNPEVNLHALAKETKTTKAFVSKILNVKFQMNFNQYVNSIRIKHVVEEIQKNAHRNSDRLSIEDVYLQAGFKSKSTFNRHFRRIMSQTPTQFIDTIKKREV